MSDRIRISKPRDGKLSRRQFVAGLGAAATLAAAGRPARAQSSGQVVFATWGGSWETAMRKAWFDPFAAETGIDVLSVSGNSYGKLQSMVEAGNTQWDIVEVNPDFQWIGPERGLLAPIDWSVVDKSKILEGENLVTDYSVPQVLWSRVLVYSTSAYKDAPKGWADFFDRDAFPGRRAIPSEANSGAFEAALIADGVPADQLYPLDIERALKKLDTIRDDILFFETNAQGQQYMTDGQAPLGLLPDGRAISGMKNGAPIAIQYNQSQMDWSAMVVPKGAPNEANAMKLLAYCLTPKAQAAIAMEYTYGPVVPAAYEIIPPERAKILSGGPQQQGKYFFVDERWWGENLEKVTEQLNAWRLG